MDYARYENDAAFDPDVQNYIDSMSESANKAFDIMPVSISNAHKKDYISAILFLKILSDIDFLVRDVNRKDLENADWLEFFNIPLDWFNLPEGCSFYDILKKRNHKKLALMIDAVFRKIEQSNPETFKGVFHNIKFNNEGILGSVNESDTIIKALLRHFGDVGTLEELNGQTFGFIYNQFLSGVATSSRKELGDFFTPESLCLLISTLVDAQPGETIYDPACGSASLLVNVDQLSIHDGELYRGSKGAELYGQEIIPQSCTLAQMNTFLNLVEKGANIRCGNSITNPAFKEGDFLKQFDVVVSNPPMGMSNWGYDIVKDDPHNCFQWEMPLSKQGDYAFISHMLASAKSGSGRVVALVPQGVLFHGHSVKNRKAILKDNLLDAVIVLPSGLLVGTNIPVAILVFDRSRERGGKNQDKNNVLFIDASFSSEDETWEKGLDIHKIDKIAEMYKSRTADKDWSALARLEEIEANDYNLSVNRYVKKIVEKDDVDIQSVKANIESLETELKNIEEKLEKALENIEI